MATPNIWDRAARYAIRQDPAAFYEWTLNLPRDEPYFAGWEDTRNVPFPSDPDRTRDIVARMQDLEAGGEPWAVVTEVQAEPDPHMLGRVNVYGGSFWSEQKPDPERGSRFFVAALVVHLAKRGPTAAGKLWQRTGLQSLASPKCFDVEYEDAAETLARIESGDLGLAILPWIPLMQTSNNEDIIKQWKKLGEQETDRRKKSDYASLAVLFAEKAGCQAIWEDQLKEWNVEESVVFEKWTKLAEQRGEERGEKRGEKRGAEKGERKGILDTLVVGLKHRFGKPGATFAKSLRQVEDLGTLRSIQKAFFTCNDLDELRHIAES